MFRLYLVIFSREKRQRQYHGCTRETRLHYCNGKITTRQEHIIVKKNSIKNVERNLNSIIKVWLKSKFISKQTYNSLYSSDSNLPKAYGLPKIHKDNYSLRIIVSSVNTALCAIAKFMHNIISNSLTHSSRHVNNSFELHRSLSNKTIKMTYYFL